MSLISVFEEDMEEATNPKNHAKPEEEIEYEEEEDEIEDEEE
jgi:hypothetical protein